jgi:hypothetical protein
MKQLGVFLVVIGLIWAVVAFNMDTTVTSEGRYEQFGGVYAPLIHIPSVTVHNTGLLETRRNHLMFAGLTAFAGVILIGFGSIQPPKTNGVKPCPICAEMIQPNAVKCRYCSHDLPSTSGAPLFATGTSPESPETEQMLHYGVTRNGEYFMLGEMHFDDLNDALYYARYVESQKHRA